MTLLTFGGFHHPATLCGNSFGIEPVGNRSVAHPGLSHVQDLHEDTHLLVVLNQQIAIAVEPKGKRAIDPALPS